MKKLILLFAMLLALIAPAPAQTSPVGFNLVIDTRGTFSTVGHYRFSYVDPVPALGLKFQTEAWVLGGLTGSDATFGAAWVFSKRLNGQISVFAGPEGRFVSGERPAGGLIFGFDFTPRVEVAPAKATLTVISGRRSAS